MKMWCAIYYLIYAAFAKLRETNIKKKQQILQIKEAVLGALCQRDAKTVTATCCFFNTDKE